MALDRGLRWGFAALAIAWAIVLPLAASFAATPHAATGEYVFAALAYTVGGIICHQQPGRSFHLFGVQLPVCARCTGIYAGAALAAVLVAARSIRIHRVVDAKTDNTSLKRAVLIAACVPIALTLVFEWTTGITPSNTIRALSGLPLGATVAWLIVGPLG